MTIKKLATTFSMSKIFAIPLYTNDRSDGYVLPGYGDIDPLKKKINQLIDEIEEIKISLLRIKKDRPHPKTRSPYDLNKCKKHK